MKKRLLALILAGVLLVGSAGAAFTATKTYAPGQFTDVTANAWYAASVKKVYELNLMNGSSTTTFNPGGMFTVAEALTVAGRMHSLAHGGSGTLPTASGPWYQNAVDYCTKNKLITADQFDSYTRAATRAEMAGVIRAALPDDQWKAINSVSALPDVNMGNEYAQAIFDLYNAGVFTGSDDYGMFQPYAYITRAEVAAIVARCADPSQRKTLNLKPLSQRQAPELLGGYKSDRKMSNGRLAYQDPTSKKWGYLDGNGTAVIPAQYDKVENFENGYAKVQNGVSWGLINTAGAAVVPLKYSNIRKLSDGAYTCTAYRKEKGEMVYLEPVDLFVNGRIVTKETDTYKWIDGLGDGLYRFRGYLNKSLSGVIDANGKVILPCQFWGDISWSGIYFTCNTKTSSYQSNQYDIYDRNGVKLLSGLDSIYPTWNNPLLPIKEGEKYAVAVGGKKITEAVYDSVNPIKNSNLAYVHYGDLTGLVGMSGVIMTPEKCSIQFDDGLVYVGTSDGGLKVLDGTGVRYEFPVKPIRYSKIYDGYDDVKKYGDYFFGCSWSSGGSWGGDLFDATGEKVASAESSSYFDLVWYKDGEDIYVINRTGETYGPYTNWSWNSSVNAAAWNQNKYGAYLYCTNPDKTYDVFDGDGNRILQDGYLNNYVIRKNDAGKPIVAYGNDTWTNVIEFYKNNMYYDEIKDIGEGYYACRFNTTWYLLHA